ncbi:hypothetical protein FE634_09595 [Nocardioides dongxiaopingii]|uniref:hypothetical protein n=1 Tax=Nocardioides sp. S-1144 TaxID=2582905 RepID=UPI00110E02C2|nr:hypothetical protein [Nocardioides sp. S-1144]QCW50605.1 hypothetical protein FE634_09595 [Nocardioides sp. S-1144]
MSESENESAPEGISDEQLPADLVPGDDNPLAGGLDDGETVDDLLTGGKTAEQPEETDVDAGGSPTSQDGANGAS